MINAANTSLTLVKIDGDHIVRDLEGRHTLKLQRCKQSGLDSG